MESNNRFIKDILIQNKFVFNKALGQNFIFDANLLESIVNDAGITDGDTVVEIGAGAGTLTKALCAKARRVIAFEIDKKLMPVLDAVLFGISNCQVVFKDVMKLSDKEIADIAGKKFKVVANLPYYITTAYYALVESHEFDIESLTFMVQKEVAARLCAKENTPEYGAITPSLKLRGDVVITRTVDRRAFFPSPKVDSAVARIDMHNKYADKNIPKILRLIKIAFSMRRKTLINNLAAATNISKDRLRKELIDCGFDERIRGEVLSLEDFIFLSEKLDFAL